MSASAVPNATQFMLVAAQDAPLYYECGLAMNTAWGAMARNPCSMATWEASDKMKEMVPKCSKLRYGERYTESYRALKLDQDTWCGPPYCTPECQEGVKCFRMEAFPFEPRCERYPTTAPPAQAIKSGAYSNRGVVALAAVLL